MRSLRAAVATLPYGQQPSIVHLYDAPLPRTSTRKIKRGEVAAILRRMMAATAPADEATAAAGLRAPGHRGGEWSIHRRSAASKLRCRGSRVRLADAHGASRGARIKGEREFGSGGAPSVPHRGRHRKKLAGETGMPPAPSPAREGRGGFGVEKDRDGGEEADRWLRRSFKNGPKRSSANCKTPSYGQVMQPRVTGARGSFRTTENTIVVANHASQSRYGLRAPRAREIRRRRGLARRAGLLLRRGGSGAPSSRILPTCRPSNRKNETAFVRASCAKRPTFSSAVARSSFPEGTRKCDGRGGRVSSRWSVTTSRSRNGIDILPVYLGGHLDSDEEGGHFAHAPEHRGADRVRPFTVADMAKAHRRNDRADAAREVARLVRQAVSRAVGRQGARSCAPRRRVISRKSGSIRWWGSSPSSKSASSRAGRKVGFVLSFTPSAATRSPKWTVMIDPASCSIKLGKPEGGTADCVLKTSPEIFTKIVRESYLPGPAEFLSGAVKSNDVSLLSPSRKPSSFRER